jgi:hypothetical protein
VDTSLAAETYNVIYISIPVIVSVLIALISVLWHAGTAKGKEDERYTDTDRRLTRLETRVFRNGGNGGNAPNLG